MLFPGGDKPSETTHDAWYAKRFLVTTRKTSCPEDTDSTINAILKGTESEICIETFLRNKLRLPTLLKTWRAMIPRFHTWKKWTSNLYCIFSNCVYRGSKSANLQLSCFGVCSCCRLGFCAPTCTCECECRCTFACEWKCTRSCACTRLRWFSTSTTLCNISLELSCSVIVCRTARCAASRAGWSRKGIHHVCTSTTRYMHLRGSIGAL